MKKILMRTRYLEKHTWMIDGRQSKLYPSRIETIYRFLENAPKKVRENWVNVDFDFPNNLTGDVSQCIMMRYEYEEWHMYDYVLPPEGAEIIFTTSPNEKKIFNETYKTGNKMYYLWRFAFL